MLPWEITKAALPLPVTRKKAGRSLGASILYPVIKSDFSLFVEQLTVYIYIWIFIYLLVEYKDNETN